MNIYYCTGHRMKYLAPKSSARRGRRQRRRASVSVNWMFGAPVGRPKPAVSTQVDHNKKKRKKADPHKRQKAAYSVG